MGQSRGVRSSAVGRKALAYRVLSAKGCPSLRGLRGASSGSFVPVAPAAPPAAAAVVRAGVVAARGVTWPPRPVSEVAPSSRGRGEGQPRSSGLARPPGPPCKYFKSTTCK